MPDGPRDAPRSQLLALPVIQLLEPADHAEPAEIDLAGAGVVADVVRLAGAVGQHADAALARADGVRDARPRRSRHHAARPHRVRLLAQLADAVADQHDEQLLLGGLAVGDADQPARIR